MGREIMNARLFAVALTAAMSVNVGANAQGIQDLAALCGQILQWGVFDVTDKFSESEQIEQVKNVYCQSGGGDSSKTKNISGDITTVIAGIPVIGGGSYNKSTIDSWYQQTCTDKARDLMRRGYNKELTKKASDSITAAWKYCIGQGSPGVGGILRDRVMLYASRGDNPPYSEIQIRLDYDPKISPVTLKVTSFIVSPAVTNCNRALPKGGDTFDGRKYFSETYSCRRNPCASTRITIGIEGKPTNSITVPPDARICGPKSVKFQSAPKDISFDNWTQQCQFWVWANNNRSTPSENAYVVHRYRDVQNGDVSERWQTTLSNQHSRWNDKEDITLVGYKLLWRPRWI